MVTTLAVVSMLLADSALELNRRGEALMQGGHDSDALRLFRRAADADSRLARAFYNQALAMADLRRRPDTRICPSKKDVLDAVEQALELDPRLRSHAEVELPAVRSTFRGQRLLGRTVDRDTAAILHGITWRSRAGETLEFLGDGTLHYWRYPNSRQLAPPAGGRWSAERGRVTIELGQKTFEGRLDDEGVLAFGGLNRFFDW